MKNNLKRIRVEKRISFNKCVEMTGIPESTLKRYELGQTPNGLEHVIRLADFYDVPLDDMFERKKRNRNNDMMR